jgi:predicted ATPase/DNA-binding SARP family transcriptional activator
LIAAAGQPVTDDRLVDVVWGADAPADASAALRVYVSRLRHALGDRHRDLLERTRSGYVLRLAPDGTDTARFIQAVERGRLLLADGNALSAVRVLGDALGLWRGEAFADLPDADLTEGLRARLAESRGLALEERAAARLAMGDPAQAVIELSAAAAGNPYRERLWALLALGLYRGGRQADSLAALRRVRTVLTEELGVDPGTDLQELERRVLAQDPHLLLPGSPGRADPTGPADRVDGGGKPTRDARSETPPPGVRRKPLRRPFSSFHGRGNELASLATALAADRLVTLVGPAGVGKTRLAIEYLAEHPSDDGPWLARLADVSQPDDLTQAVIDAVGLTDATGDALATLTRALAVRPGLLLLDNCEHLIDEVAHLSLTLLEQCPRLRILNTSREPLGVDGETVLPLDPLPLLTDDGSDGPAVTLLLDRVGAVRSPDWTPSTEERTHARQVCVALDGLPLALELAAARARALDLHDIAERLDDRFQLLRTAPRGSLTTHATLHAAIGWSVEQLSDPDRALLFRLWPFEGGFSLEAADAVRPDDVSILDAMSTLVSRSVVVADTTMNPTRYRLLETLRAYCRDNDPNPTETQDIHASWVRDFVGQHLDDLVTPHGGHVIRLLRRELPNLRAGIARDLAARPSAALRTVVLLRRFWFRQGHVAELHRLLHATLKPAMQDPALDPRHLTLARAALAMISGDAEELQRGYTEVTVPTGHNRESWMVYVLTLQAYSYGANGLRVPDVAMDAAARWVHAGHELGEDWIVASGRAEGGAAFVLRGQHAEGELALAEAIDLAERCESIWTAAWAQLILAQVVLRRAPADPEPERLGRHTLKALHRTAVWFRREEDITLSIVALYLGSIALAVAGRSSEATRLRDAVHDHAQMLGVPLDFVHRLGSMAGELEHRDVPDGESTDRGAAAAIETENHQGAPRRWADMLEMLAPH